MSAHDLAMYSIKFPDGLDTASFLKGYWQQKALYMPQAWPGFENPLPAEELAGLALEQAFPSRLVVHESPDKWTLRQGPFTTEIFAELDGKPWSLLITDIEKHLPDFKSYVEPFRFIPDWRFDDLMISYATPGGSVGPHMDDYDVFLMQAQGQRNWALERGNRNLPMPEHDLLGGTDLRLIKDFDTHRVYTCSPGDILYVPPRLGHYGVAIDECMTWSIGFKAPDFHTMLMAYLEGFEYENQHKRYKDPDLKHQQNPGEITPRQLDQIKNWFVRQIDEDNEVFSRWAARFLSDDLSDLDTGSDEKGCASDIGEVEVNPFVRFNFITLKGQTYLYAGGEEFKISLKFAKTLTTSGRLQLASVHGRDKSLAQKLIAKEFLLPVEC